jgi:hypothetical protein
MIEGAGARGRQPIETELAVEAVLSLLLAKAALRVVPFRLLERLFVLPLCAAELEGPERSETRAAVLLAVETAARRLPVATACFPRAIALQAMLRRRGVPVELVYGASGRPGAGVNAHVWIEDEGVAVLGGEEALGLAVLARYGAGGGGGGQTRQPGRRRS